LNIKICIEHLEESYSLWLLYEYINASKLIGRNNIIYSNISSGRIYRILSRYGKVYKNRLKYHVSTSKILVLDPDADIELKYSDLNDIEYIVVGGILGEHPRRGRTKKLLSNYYRDSKVRNIGDGQYSIDGAVYMAYLISNSMDIREIPKVNKLKIFSDGYITELPYIYPIRNGEPIISSVIMKIINEIGIFDEYWVREI